MFRSALLPGGAVGTPYAAHCQRETGRQVRERKADCVLCVEQNQHDLRADIEELFARVHQSPGAQKDWLAEAGTRKMQTSKAEDMGYGRLETRITSVLQLAAADADWSDVQKEFARLRSLLRVERTRRRGLTKTCETIYYVSSLTHSAPYPGRSIRQHGGIENRLHCVLDVSLGEDTMRVRADPSARNLGLMRAIVLSSLGKPGLRAYAFRRR